MVSCCLEAKDVNPQWRTRPDLYLTIGGFAAASATKMIVSRIAGSSAIRFGGISNTVPMAPTIVRFGIESRDNNDQSPLNRFIDIIAKRLRLCMYHGL
jgi:hypothetical protein